MNDNDLHEKVNTQTDQVEEKRRERIWIDE
jgi:hypothetical protein